MTEGSDAVFKLTRTGDTDDALTVALSASETGSMISGAAPTSVTFAAEASETELRIPAAADTTDEDDSTLTVTPTAGDTYPLDTNEQRTAALTVLDDDAAELPGGTVAVAGTTVWTADMTVTDYGNGSIGAGTASLLANPAHGARRVPARHEYVDEVVDPATQRPGPDLVADARTNGERLKHGLLLGPLTLGTRRDHAYYVKLAVAPMPATPGARALARRELVITRRWSYCRAFFGRRRGASGATDGARWLAASVSERWVELSRCPVGAMGIESARLSTEGARWSRDLGSAGADAQLLEACDERSRSLEGTRVVEASCKEGGETDYSRHVRRGALRCSRRSCHDVSMRAGRVYARRTASTTVMCPSPQLGHVRSDSAVSAS